ncbi:MAG: DUF4173 domain-containing protein [Maledivibacter sp.]|nr:DUF4173 domain-containing protein [Maledivibacter sp.]
MGVKKIQALIINRDKILLKDSNDKSINRNSFITICVDENEDMVGAIKGEIRKLLNLDCKITFKFNKDKNSEVTTFLIDLSDKEIEACNRNSLCEDEGLEHLIWVDLRDKNYYSSYEYQYIKLLLEECIKLQYQASWTKIIAEVYFNDFASINYLNRSYLTNHRKEKDLQAGLQEKIKVMLMAFILGILFNYFFIWDSIGISAVVFILAVIGFSVYSNYAKMDLNKRLGWMFLIPIIFLSFTYSIYNNWVLRSLNAIIIPILITSYIIIIRYENIKDIKVAFFNKIFRRIFNTSFSTAPKFFSFVKELIKNRRGIEENSTKKNIIKGLIISIPLLLIIVSLLTSADMMFKYYVENIGNNMMGLNPGSLIGHSLVIVIITLYTFGFIWSLNYDYKEDYIQKNNNAFPKWEPVTIITIIFVICVVYLLFSIVQFSYLYGGAKNILPSGFTYAEYARKGFFELVLVTLINFALLAISIKLTNRDNPKINKITNTAYSFLILFTFNMLFSANYKMNMYEMAFGFTRLRIFVQVFMLLLGILLLIVLLGIWIKRVPMLKSAIIATMIVYIVLNYANIDKIIAKKNIDRYRATQKIDMMYLKKLSYDAYGEIIKLMDIGSKHDKLSIKRHINYEKEKLIKEYDHWYEFNYYKYKLLRILEYK